MKILILLLFCLFVLMSCQTNSYDLIIRNGSVIDGSGSEAFKADVAIKDGKIVDVSKTINGTATLEINAGGQIVCPGFIDILSWASGPILYDGEVHSVVRQGITTAIFGEGWSMGPVNNRVRDEMKEFWPEYGIDYKWETLAEYLNFVEQKGTSVNIASFVGATTVRLYVIGTEDRKATVSELQQMKDLVRREMEAGALGVASSLVYTPAFYAGTEEIIELTKVAAEYGGIYISHIRGEGADLIEAIHELITVSELAKIPAEIYHLKAAGQPNWAKLDQALELIEAAREKGLDITADIYPYTAGATKLAAMIPPWAKEGGAGKMVERLSKKETRLKIRQQIQTSFSGWENFYWLAGGGDNILVSYLLSERKHLQGKTIAEIAREQNKDDLDTVLDLLIAENGGGGGIYFLMSEDNVKKKMRLPWVSFCTDEDAYKTEGLMAKRNPHPRAYGTFPRVLGKYVREEKVLSLHEAIRKMTSLPARRAGLSDRGLVQKEYAADIVIFDAQRIIDRATYTEPHQYPEGINHVIVNGTAVVKNGRHTGAQPGKALFKLP
jgi:N-acyl-D-amino-acid deacylase